MQVQETRVFSFVCPYIDGSLKTFQVAAESQQESASLLKEWLSKAQLELSMLFPQVAPEKDVSEFNQMQIGLLDDLAKSCGMKDNEALATFIEKKTKLPMTVANFKKIVPMLEGIRDGNIPNG